MAQETDDQYSQPTFLDDYDEDSDNGHRSGSGRERRRANDLDGRTWLRYSISIWSDIRKSTEELELNHPAIFPIALVTRLIEMFTRAEDKVIFDPFAGVGSTLLAAMRAGKLGVGTELNPEYVAKAEQRFKQAGLFQSEAQKPMLHCANANRMLEFVDHDSVDLVVTSPPYWDVLNMKRTADYKDIRNYGEEAEDLGRVPSYTDFLFELKVVFSRVLKALRPGAYCCVVVMDLRKKDRFYPFHSDLARNLQDAGFIYDDLIIWDRRHEYNNMRPLGYPSVFRVNKAHEYVLIFQKPRD